MASRHAVIGFLAVLLVGMAAAQSPANDLFKDIDVEATSPGPVTSQPAVLPEDTLAVPRGALRSRLVEVDHERLDALRQGIPVRPGDPQTLNLFDDVSLEVVFERVVPAVSGYALHGRLLGVESGTATLVVRGRIVTGTVNTPGSRYTIAPAGAGLHAIAELDWTLAPETDPIAPDDAPVDHFQETDQTSETDTPPVQRAKERATPTPAASPAPSPAPSKPPLPTVNSNVWQPQGPGRAGRNGGLLDGQVENVEPNDAVIGAIHTVLAHPSDPDILYVGTVNGGVWKTTDATDSNPDWTPLTDDMGSLSIGAMAFDPADPDIIVVGIGRYSSFGRRGGDRNGLFLTRDGGESWTALDDPLLVDVNVSGVSINGDRIVVAGSPFTVTAGHRGVLRSEDAGVTWATVTQSDGLPENRGVFDMVDDPSDPDRFYVSVERSGIFRSDDGGATWVDASEGDEAIQAVMTHRNNNNAEMAVAHDGRVYLAAMIGGQAQYIGYTDDQGNTWTAMDLPQTPESDGDIEGLNPRFKPGAQGYIHFAIRVDPEDSRLVYVGGDRQDGPFPNFIGARNYTGRLFRGNATVEATDEVPSPQWEHLTHSAFISDIPGGGTASNSAPHADSRELVFDAAGDLIEVDDGGIYRRTSPRDNTGDWFSLNGNLQVTEMHDVAYDTLSNVIVSGNQDVANSQQTAPGSVYWDTVGDGDGGDVVIDVSGAPVQSERYLSSQYLGRFSRHTYDADNQRLGTSAPSLLVNGAIRLTNWESRLQFVQRFELNAMNANRAVLGASAVYESYDEFETLEEAYVLGGRFDLVRATAYGCADDPALLYVGHGFLQGPRVAVREGTSDFRETTYPGGYPVDIVIHADDCDTVYVIDAQAIWSSQDTGETWQEITGNLVDTPVRYRDLRKLEFVPAGEIFQQAAIAVAGRAGVQVMNVTEEGEWYDLGVDLPDVPVFDLDYDLEDHVLIVGSLGRGAWMILSAAPVVLIGVPDQALEVDGESTLDLSSLFHSTHESLTYSVLSSDEAVVAVSLSGTDLTIEATRAGAATVTVTATDGDGLMGSYTFTVTVGTVVSFAKQPEPVPEGGIVTFAVDLNRSSTTAIDVGYTIVAGDDAGTPGADADDHDGADGTLSFAPGVTSQEFEIGVIDDDEIEPVREAFTVKIGAPGGEDTWGLGLIPDTTVRIKEGVCDRSPDVRDALARRDDCTEVSELDIASIRHLNLDGLKIAAFKSRDFLGLSGLSRLEIFDNPFTTLPEGLFDGLTGLVTLEVARNQLETIPESLLAGLPRLRSLKLQENRLRSLPDGTFGGLHALEHLDLTGNSLSALPGTVFDDLHGLKVLSLNRNQIAALPAGVFNALTEVNVLDLGENQMTELPAGAFDTLREMNTLMLSDNQMATLPEGVFDELDNLGLLLLDDNELDALPMGVFSGPERLARLHLDGNRLSRLPAAVFEGVGSLTLLHLQDNPGAPFMLAMAPVRTDATELTAPGPATVTARVVEGAPFPMSARLAVTNGTASADEFKVASGQTASESITITAGDGKAIVGITDVSPVPVTDCGRDGPCFQGVETAAGDPIAIFEGPAVTTPVHDQTLESSGDGLVIDLAQVFSADPGTTLVFSVVSSNPDLITVNLRDGLLTITADGDEGDATIAITATDNLGRTATLEFDVTIGLQRGNLRGWRLGVLAEEVKAAEEADDAEP